MEGIELVIWTVGYFIAGYVSAYLYYRKKED